MISARRYEDLVASIYEAGADFRRWPDTLRQIAAAYHARTAVFGSYTERAEDGWTIAPDIDQSVHDRYTAHFHAINPIWRRTFDMAPGDVRTDAMIVPRREFVTTEFFHDFLRPQDIGSMLGVAAHNRDGRLCVISVQRKRPFDDEETALYRRLAPRVERAVRLNLELTRLEMRCAASAEALDMLEKGALLVDAHCRVLFANRIAERLVRADGALRLVNGILQARSADETSKLRALVGICGASGADAPDGSLSLSRASPTAPLTLSVLPLRAQMPAFRLTSPPVAIVFVDAPDHHPGPSAADRIKRRYGLSCRETAFALEVVKGEGLQACADQLGITLATARTHLAHIFEKTGAHRQAELVRILMEA